MKKSQQPIIRYTREQLTWHLTNNVRGLSETTVSKICDTCDKVNAGEYFVDIDAINGVTISEMLDDLRIDYNQPS